MPSLIHTPESGPTVWPYTQADLRQDNPNVSFPANPSAEDLAPFGVHWVADTEQPTSDPRGERVEEVKPTYDENGWRQQWRIRAATPEEVAAYDELNRPAPNWPTFKAGLLTSSAVSQTMAAARAAGCEPAVSALPVALEKAVAGDPAEFAACWALVATAGAADPETLAPLVAAAEACHLPADFVAALVPERERARDEQGRFIADDPATPQDEAWASAN